MRLAFFDMDRTILSQNSGTSWLRFQYKRGELSASYMVRALYWQLLYRLALLDMETLATRLVSDLKGELESEMLETCEEWLAWELASLVSPAALAQIEAHQNAGDLVAIISGASQFAAEPIAKLVGIDHVICSRLEVVEGVFTGKLATMCFGEHKVALAERFASEHDLRVNEAIFYTDSYNDFPLLKRVAEGVAVNADARLLRQARKRGWRVENWAS